MERHFYCDYKTAVHWRHNSIIQFEEIWNLDDEFYENIPEVLDGDIYQTFMTDCSDGDVEYLKERFPELIFGYSFKFEKWFLCVDHYGTAWDWVELEIAKRKDESEESYKCALQVIKKYATNFHGDLEWLEM